MWGSEKALPLSTAPSMPEEADERREDGTTQSLVPDPQDTCTVGLMSVLQAHMGLASTADLVSSKAFLRLPSSLNKIG